ncbi:MAG: thioredoxin-dependent thiol peroxidase [Bacteroidales bacterium]|jgi:peroxiredoxin Q/BCP|nr:thioredoxin-dependent thiol peroxidase [Bacteroidales bacterium]MDD3272558.1 thioredoxin-dependent thiol peroxidase [Bacteroidales bacterium]MDD4057681.1 thioredoxin-dependent thiol peroxidase [Bacteroidales bacterium]
MLNKGDKAPDFKGVDQDGKEITLKDFKGKKLVLYFYPKDNTPGCTAEACDLRDNYSRFESMGYKIVGVSKDSEKSHKGFIEKHHLPFPLLSDKEAVILKAYDAWGRKKFMGREYDGIIRKTFVIDEEGVIIDIIEKVDTKAHSKQIIG